jgi:Protein of unknown function (DUF1552)
MKPRPFRHSVSRRALLSTFAGLGAAGYFKTLLRDAFASEAPPQRFALLWNPHGYAPELWRPRAADGGPPQESGWVLDFDPDASLGPLEPHKDSLLIVEGLDFACVYPDEAMPLAGPHDAAKVGAITGRHSRALNDHLRTDGPSIDHAIAKALGTRPFLFKPLGYPLNFTSISYDDAGEEIPFEYDLLDSLRDWFGVGPAAAQAEEEIAADSAVLSFLQADARRLRGRLAPPEQQKLDAHLDALHVIEQRLKRPIKADCSAPPQSGLALEDEGYLRTVMDFSLQLFNCGLTSQVTLNLDIGQLLPWLGFGELRAHDDIAHGYRPGEPATVRALAKLQRWYTAQVAYFIEGLKALPEGGGTAYDNTVILWASEFGDPARHMLTHAPFVVGGGGAGFKNGRFLSFGGSGEYADPARPHNQLLASVGNLFGLDLAGFGDPRFPGELSGFRG